MKTQNMNNKLAFNKASVAELNDYQLDNINGGTSTSSWGCMGLVAVAIYDAGVEVGHMISKQIK